MPSEYAKTLGARLRAIRTQQGLSLHGVEEKSRGRWKAVVVGSYERGDRSVTVQKLAELAEFYGVPVSELLPGDAAPTPIASAPKLVIDLERMNQLPKEKVGPLARYVATIQAQRGDRSVTVQKLAELAEFYGVPVSELLPGDAAPTPIASAPKLVIDLERMNQLPKEKVGPLARYVATIQAQRGDYNGRVLSVRHEDLRSLAVIYDKSPADLTEELISWGVLDADARSNSIESF